MRAVIYTDIAQFLVLWGSMLVVTLVAWSRCDTDDVLARAAEGGRAGWSGPGGLFQMEFDLASPFSFWMSRPVP